MDITSRFTGGRRFETKIRGHTVVVDQPLNESGMDTGPTPPELLVASLGTCIGVYAIFFCEKHHISPEGLAVYTHWEKTTNPRASTPSPPPSRCRPGYRKGSNRPSCAR